MDTKSKIVIIILFITFLIPEVFGITGRYRLMFNGNPSTEVTVGFDAYSINTNPVLYYSTSSIDVNNLNNYQSQTPDVVKDYRGMINTFVRLKNLQPGQRYFFVIKDASSISQVYQFETTSNSNDAELSILGGGDSRNLYSVRRVANRVVSKLHAHALMFDGDLTDEGTETEWKRWLEDWQLAISKNNRITPLIVARGNHEKNNEMLMNLFDCPANIYYANSMGGNLLRIYTLNSELSFFGEQTDWIEGDLQANRNAIWKIVQYHKPIRPHVKFKLEGHRQYGRWANLFYQEGVDIVLEGDGHTVKTTWPLVPCGGGFACDQGFKRNDINGTVYIGEGSYAAPIRNDDDRKLWTRDSGKFHQFKWLFINKQSVEIRTIRYTEDTDTDIIQTLNENTRFTIPQNLNIWSPSNGDVITLKSRYSEVPDCSITKPFANSYFSVGDEIKIEAQASGKASIDRVEFYINGVSIKVDDSAPYSLYWYPIQNGMFSINAIAVDVNGISSPITNKMLQVTPKTNMEHTASIDIHSDEYYEEISTGKIENLYDGKFKVHICSDGDYLQGFRFKEISLPKNAIIESATILFDNIANDSAAIVTIWGEKSSNSTPFINEDYNISNRTKTDNTVVWENISNWHGTIPEASRTTPDLSGVVQELVNQPDWSANSPVTFLFTGSGKREARSFRSINQSNSNGYVAPSLTVVYSLPQCPDCATVSNTGESYFAKSCVISNDSIAPGTLTISYLAGDYIQLKSGFSLPAGTNLYISTNPCTY